jgi:uncharacterized protein (TIGR03083 family)
MSGGSTSTLSHEQYLTVVQADARRFADLVATADPTARVPSCPDWDLAELCRHTGLVHRWVTQVVRTRAQDRIAFDGLPDATLPDSPAERSEWLLRGAAELVDLLRAGGTDTEVWGWAREQHTGWWGRRMAHETLVHRIDAELAAGRPSTVAPDLAADAIDELLHNAGAPTARTYSRRDRLRGEGGTLHVHCTDTHGEWLLRRTPDGFAYDLGHAKGEAALRGPAAQLMLLLLHRLPDGTAATDVEVLGDAPLVDLWLDGLTFG